MPTPRNCPSLLALVLVACGGGSDDTSAGTLPQTPQAAQAAVQAATAAMQDRAVEAVDPQRLEELLPQQAADLPRTDVQRNRTGAAGMEMSAVNARYDAGDRRSLTISIADIGGMGGMGMMANAAWAMTDFDRTTTNGYEKTTRLDEFKALESVDRAGSSTHARLSVIVGDRFIVQLEGRDVDIDALRSTARALSLRRLASTS